MIIVLTSLLPGSSFIDISISVETFSAIFSKSISIRRPSLPLSVYQRTVTPINIQFIIQDNQSGVIYDASNNLVSATWSGQIAGQPGKLTFDVVRDGALKFYEGSPCSLIVNGYKLFFGWVFSKSRTKDILTAVTAYDQKRYLKNSDTKNFPESTGSDRFKQLCGDFGLRNSVVNPSGVVLPPKIYDNKTIGDMVEDGIDLTLINSGKWYVVRDVFGALEWLDIAGLHTNLILGDFKNMTGYDYQTSIDEDTYNQIKLVQENKKTEKRDVYIVKDSSTIARWGLLQYYEKVDENATEAQIRQRADQLIKLKNRVTRKLTIDAIGDFRVMPGNSIWVETQMDDMMISRYMLVHAVSHTIKNRLHTMNVTLEVVE